MHTPIRPSQNRPPLTASLPHHTPASPDDGHFHDLDGVRGVLAIVVMLYHYGLNSVLGAVIGINTVVFDVCVDFFFILSGLVIARSVLRRDINVRGFIARRFCRLFPLHIAILVVFAPVLFFGMDLGAVEFVLEITAFAPLVLRELQNFPAWSLGFEFYGPILFVALLALKRPTRRQTLALGAALFVLSAIALQQTLTRQDSVFGPYLDYVRAFSGLGLGFILSLLFQDSCRPLSDLTNRIVFPLTIGAFFIVTILSAVVPMLAWTMPIVLILAMATGMGSRTLFASRLFRFLGSLSFGIYMVHIPILFLFLRLFGEEAQSGNLALKAAMIGCCFVAAYVLHWLVERPGLTLMNVARR